MPNETTPTKHIDLKPSDFPFVITAHRSSNGEEVWRRAVDGPNKVWIPPLARQIGEPVTIRILWNDGRVTEQGYG